MSIRSKVIALIAAVLVIMGMTQIFVGHQVLMSSFTELEHDDAYVAMRRIDNALDLALMQLQLSADDWGNWADTYRFAQDHNPAYVADNITTIGLKQLHANVLLVADASGEFVLSSAMDLSSERVLDIDFVRRGAFAPDFPWRRQLNEGREVRGLLQTDRGILMLAGAPILNGNGAGPVRGMLLVGRLLTVAEIERLGIQAQAKVTLLPTRRQATKYELSETDAITQVFRTLNDIYGQPILTLRVDVPRRITQQGYAAIRYASASLIGAAVAVLLVLTLLLNKMVLAPLACMTRHARAVGAGAEAVECELRDRPDEFGVLAREFDRMVVRLAETRRELVDQSFQSGFAELAKGVLHNLGNAMTPIGVRLAVLGQRLKSAPAAEAAQATTELADLNTDAERRADLEEFMRLACGEFSRTIEAAHEDIAVLTRQTALVQSTLAEQMRSTRGEQVIEAVRLADLLAQSLEVVPDSSRERLRVEADDSLQRVGVVRVARTVLRLVLQNLIINAAESVRDAGKARGQLRLSADIITAPEGEQLYLRCQDDGIGIDATNLERIFERGFSTKGAANFGIGLHWCANAIGALRGRIWAASAGHGLGATLHVMVPLPGDSAGSAANAA